MLVRPDLRDLRLIALSLGRILTVAGLLTAPPALVALARGEWNALSALVVGGALAVTAGRVAVVRFRSRRAVAWSHGMVTVGLAWLVVPLFTAVPLYLSGHLGSFLDAYLDSISGVTTTGLTVLQDLDHLPISMNLYRHLLHFAGGQGIVIVVLTLFTVASAQGGSLYLGETRDDRLTPNFARTARFVLRVAVTYLAVSTLALTLAGMSAGMSAGRSVTHAVALFLAAYDTGGFTLQSTSVAYYHSPVIEGLVVALMLAGAMSYGLHYQLWRGNRRELLRNVETRTITATFAMLLAVIFLGFGRSGAFTDAGPMFRRGFFALVSAHTTTGLSTTDARLIAADWGLIAPAAIVTAMAVGGMAASSAGGIKAIRVGLTLKGVGREVRRVLLPESALVVSTYHQHRRHILRDTQIRAAASILLLFLFTFIVGGLVTLYVTSGVDFTEALLESTSAATNTGLSVGIVRPSAHTLVKLVAITQMWVGRLEFMAAFALLGYLVAIVRGRS